MTGICTACGERQRVPSHRGERMADYRCYKCDAPLKGVGAGAGKRFRCIIDGHLTEFVVERPAVIWNYQWTGAVRHLRVGEALTGQAICRRHWAVEPTCDPNTAERTEFVHLVRPAELVMEVQT